MLDLRYGTLDSGLVVMADISPGTLMKSSKIVMTSPMKDYIPAIGSIQVYSSVQFSKTMIYSKS